MKQLPFRSSRPFTIGVELEYQIIDPLTYNLISHAKDLMRIIRESKYKSHMKPEITQNMIELNTSIHSSGSEMHRELLKMRDFLAKQEKKVGVLICGGGMHPFQKWSLEKIYPTKRYKRLSHIYRYLSKRATVFGQHIHVGCPNEKDALYLTHALHRYAPHFIAINASSPFYQESYTGFNSTRNTLFNAFPQSGYIPYLLTWKEFSEFFYKLKKLKIIETMKDIYWDIRPKPEFGTVEIRVCDTPLTIEKAVIIAIYIQTLSAYLLHERPIAITKDLYYLYTYNRFQASRYGFDGELIDPHTLKKKTISEDILETLELLEKNTPSLKNKYYLKKLEKSVRNKKNDALFLKEFHKKTRSFTKVVREQCLLWSR